MNLQLRTRRIAVLVVGVATVMEDMVDGVAMEEEAMETEDTADMEVDMVEP